MDRRRDPTIARPKEKRKRGDMSHDHVRCYNVRPWSHHVLWICEWRQQPWEPELSIATRSATAGILFPRKYYSLTSVHLSCLWKKSIFEKSSLLLSIRLKYVCIFVMNVTLESNFCTHLHISILFIRADTHGDLLLHTSVTFEQAF